ncbi:MAG TPA: hypothetical protein VG078_02400 [Acidimicrobiales bacterium]|nr:hypothetical protein [Acidimicrobiales bacterium]
MRLDGVTQQDYDAVMTELGLGTPNVEENEQWPDGIISHTAGATEGGWFVVDVWESQEAFDNFFAGRLGPALQTANVQPPQVTAFDVYNRHAGT